MASFQKQFYLFSTAYRLQEPPQDLALNLKNGFVPKAFVFVFNNMVALNLIFNIFFSAQLSAKLTVLIPKDIPVSFRLRLCRIASSALSGR